MAQKTEREIIEARGQQLQKILLRFEDQKENECTIVRAFLRCMHIGFVISDLTKVSNASFPDVLFRDARFEVSMILDTGRRPIQELRNEAARVKSAKTILDLSIPWDHQRIVGCDEINKWILGSKKLKRSIRSTHKDADLLIYINVNNIWIPQESEYKSDSNIQSSGWRSVSWMRPPVACVTFTAQNAPLFLGENAEKLLWNNDEHIWE